MATVEAMPVAEERLVDKTGKGWNEWFEIIDAFGGREKGHTAVAKHLEHNHGVPPWYCQAIAVGYDRKHGGRELHQKGKHYEVSFQRTIKCSPEAAWEALTTAEGWNAWFSKETKIDLKVGGRYSNNDGDTGEFKRIEENKRLVFTWEQKQHQPGSVVDIMLLPAKSGCTVNLTHRKLASKEDMLDLKTGGWNWALDSLKSYLQTGKGIPYEDWKSTVQQ